MTCPFCKRGDPFHRTNSGEAVAVTCCDLGDMLVRGARPEPEDVTIGWDDFADIGARLGHANQVAMFARQLVEFIRDEGPPAKEWQAISTVTDELAALLNIPTE